MLARRKNNNFLKRMRSGQRRKCIVGKNAHNALHLSLLRSDKLKPTVLKKMIRSILFGVDEGLHLPLSHVGTSSKTPCTLAVSVAIMNFSKHSSFIFIVKRRKDAQILTRYCYFPLKIAYSEQNRKKIIILATFFENHLYKAVFLWYNVCGIMRRP